LYDELVDIPEIFWPVLAATPESRTILDPRKKPHRLFAGSLEPFSAVEPAGAAEVTYFEPRIVGSEKSAEFEKVMGAGGLDEFKPGSVAKPGAGLGLFSLS
jgi:hypothetical protein